MDAFADMFAEIDTIANECRDIELSAFIMEDENSETGAAIERNAAMIDRSQSIFKRIGDAIRKTLTGIKNGLKSVFEYFTASKEDRLSFDEMCREIQKDPSMKGKKVSFHDYREIMAQMNTELDKAESEYAKFKESAADEYPNLLKTINSKLEDFGIKCKEVAGAEAASFAVEVAIKYAQQSRKHAYIVQKAIDFDFGLLSAIEKEIGSKELQKAKSKIKKLNSRYSIIRTIAGGREKQYQTINTAIQEVTSSIRSLFRVHNRAKKGEHGSDVKSAERSVIKLGLDIHRSQKDGAKSAKYKLHDLKGKAKTQEKGAKEMNSEVSRMDKVIDKLRGNN